MTTCVPDCDRLLALVERLEGRKVAVFADLVVDRFISGSPKRISREAPVLILRFEGEQTIPGGGANAIANVEALGGYSVGLGVVGDDSNGSALLAELAARSISTSGIRRREGYLTPTKTRILGGAKGGIKQQIVRFDVEDHLELVAEDRQAFLNHFAGSPDAEATGVDAIIFSDYGYGSVDPKLLTDLRSAVGESVPILCDSRYRLDQFRGFDGATPNEEEAVTLLGCDLDEYPGGLNAAGQALRTRLGARFLLITRGSRGMSLFTEDLTAHLPVHGTDQVADVTGAGDTVIGTFALAVGAGASPLEAALLANYAGGVVVMKMGTATLDRRELAAAITADPDLAKRATFAEIDHD